MADHILQLNDRTLDEPGACKDEETGSCKTAGRAAGACWTVTQLRDYVAWARETFTPTVTPAARAVLLAYFQQQRAACSFDGGRAGGDRVTVRLLEGLVRLSQAHARLLARHCVTEQDACAVVLLLERCANTAAVGGGGSGGGGAALCTCELDDAEHAEAARRLMDRLGLPADTGPGGSVWDDAAAEPCSDDTKCADAARARWASAGSGEAQGQWEQGKRAGSVAGVPVEPRKAARFMPPPLARAPSAPAGGCTGGAAAAAGGAALGAARPGVGGAALHRGQHAPWGNGSAVPGPKLAQSARAGMHPVHVQQSHTSAAPGAMPACGGGSAALLSGGRVRAHHGAGAAQVPHIVPGRTGGTPAAVAGGAAHCTPNGAVLRPPHPPMAQHAASAPVSAAGRAGQPHGHTRGPACMHDVHALDLLQPDGAYGAQLGHLGASAASAGGGAMPLREIQCNANARPGEGGKVARPLPPRPHATSAPVFHFNEAEEEIDLTDIL